MFNFWWSLGTALAYIVLAILAPESWFGATRDPPAQSVFWGCVLGVALWGAWTFLDWLRDPHPRALRITTAGSTYVMAVASTAQICEGVRVGPSVALLVKTFGPASRTRPSSKT